MDHTQYDGGHGHGVGSYHYDGIVLSEIFIGRLASSNEYVAITTLALFSTLIGLACEDFMVQIIFQYLVPKNHLIRKYVNESNEAWAIHKSCLWFLEQMPKCVRPKRMQKKVNDIFRPLNATGKNGGPGAPGMGDKDLMMPPMDFTAENSVAISDYDINQDLSVTISMKMGDANNLDQSLERFMQEILPEINSCHGRLNTFIDFETNAQTQVLEYEKRCRCWSLPYSYDDPPDDIVLTIVSHSLGNTPMKLFARSEELEDLNNVEGKDEKISESSASKSSRNNSKESIEKRTKAKVNKHTLAALSEVPGTPGTKKKMLCPTEEDLLMTTAYDKSLKSKSSDLDTSSMTTSTNTQTYSHGEIMPARPATKNSNLEDDDAASTCSNLSNHSKLTIASSSNSSSSHFEFTNLHDETTKDEDFFENVTLPEILEKDRRHSGREDSGASQLNLHEANEDMQDLSPNIENQFKEIIKDVERIENNPENNNKNLINNENSDNKPSDNQTIYSHASNYELPGSRFSSFDAISNSFTDPTALPNSFNTFDYTTNTTKNPQTQMEDQIDRNVNLRDPINTKIDLTAFDSDEFNEDIISNHDMDGYEDDNFIEDDWLQASHHTTPLAKPQVNSNYNLVNELDLEFHEYGLPSDSGVGTHGGYGSSVSGTYGTGSGTRAGSTRQGSMIYGSSNTRQTVSSATSSSAYVGPFLGMILSRLEQIQSKSILENLLLCEVIEKLCAYGQPLLRSFLLDTALPLQPSIQNLAQVISSVRRRIDDVIASNEEIYHDKVKKLKKDKERLKLNHLQIEASASTSEESSEDLEQNTVDVLVQRAQRYLFGHVYDNRSNDLKNNFKFTIPDTSANSINTGMNLFGPNSAVAGFLNAAGGGLGNSQRGDLGLGGLGGRTNSFGLGGLGGSSLFSSSNEQARRDDMNFENNSSSTISPQQRRLRNSVFAAVVLGELCQELAAYAEQHAILALRMK